MMYMMDYTNPVWNVMTDHVKQRIKKMWMLVW